MPTFDAIALVVADMAAIIAFYQLLGVELPETPGEAHAALPAGPG